MVQDTNKSHDVRYLKSSWNTKTSRKWEKKNLSELWEMGKGAINR